MTSMSTPSATSTTTMVTAPPGAPDAVCTIAFVTSSDVSKVAVSASTAGVLPTAESVRATKARAPDTSSGRPGIVAEPRIAAR